VLAAGGGVIRWNGADYPVAQPEVVDWATAQSGFSPVQRKLVPLIGIERFVRLRDAPAVGVARAAQALPNAPSQE
jgi:hypothetical protein